MKQPERYRDIEIRVKLLEYLNNVFSNIEHFIAMEARYAHKERRADVLVVTANSTHAYEVKSDFDNLVRLPGQLKDYRRTFDYVSVVTTSAHEPNVKKMLGKNDGLIVIYEHEIREIIAPARNKGIEKRNIVSMCPKAVLAQYLDLPYEEYPLAELRAKAIKKLSLSSLEDAFRYELKRRFKDKYDLFMQEAYIPYRKSDLLILQGRKRLSTNLFQINSQAS